MWRCGWMVAAWWCVAVADNCDVTIISRSYREEILASDIVIANGLAVDYSNNAMYFSFYNGSYHNIKVDLGNKALTVIEELKGLCKYTVDQRRREVHAGCRSEYGASGGLYQFDSNTARFELNGEAGRDVQFVYYNKYKLYYSYYPELLLRTFDNGKSALQSTLASQVSDLVIDARGNWLFNNNTGLYLHRGDDGEERQYTRTESWVQELAVDRRGAAYVCGENSLDGVWLLHANMLTAIRLLEVACHSLAFDADNNIIYADKDRRRIVRLVPC